MAFGSNVQPKVKKYAPRPAWKCSCGRENAGYMANCPDCFKKRD